MNKIIIIFVAVLVLIGGWFAYQQLSGDGDADQANPVGTAEETEQSPYDIDEPGNLAWIVNKQRSLPDGYIPPDMTDPDIKLRWASDAESMQISTVLKADLEAMVAASKKAGHDLYLVSAYRSYDYQQQLYTNYVKAYGEEEASKFSAKPGTSEHQTGLAVDLGRTDGECEILQCFADTAEGKWLAKNAHTYGFILRYPKGKEASTGYEFEPWHFRYVGKELAEELTASGQTMEEHFEL